MRVITATEASRNFSDLLDAIERGEAVRITRSGKEVAEITPVRKATWTSLHEALADVPPLGDSFESDIRETLALLEPWDPEDVWGDD